MGAFFNSPLFETIICLVLVFALLSLLASNILEFINAYLQERGLMLYKSLSGMFSDSGNVNFGQLLYNLPSVNNLKKDRESLPQYLSKEMFATGIVDVISNHARIFAFDEKANRIVMQEDNLMLFDRFRKGVMNMEHTALKIQLLNMVEKCGVVQAAAEDKRLEKLQAQLESWFTDQMDRTTGWYKTKIRKRLFIVGIFIALMLNVDSIHIFQSLYRTPILRAQLLPVAEKLADNYSRLKNDSTLNDLQRANLSADSIRAMLAGRPLDSSSVAVLDGVLSTIQKIDSANRKTDTLLTAIDGKIRKNADLIGSLGLPIGWMKNRAPLSWGHKNAAPPKDYFERYQRFSWTNLLSYLLGLLITAISIQFGAPFWFDLLLKVVNMRRSGIKPNESK